MRVEIPNGGTFELGVTEATPTIGIVDYSRRVTDDFGVTTVVERGFSRRLSVRLGLPLDAVDAVQRTLAGLRATSALWVADDVLASLAVQGFYREFSLDLATEDLSYCTLTVEGLAETGAYADPGGDPAPAGMASTLRLLQPATITDGALVASNVTEDEYPSWVAGTTYGKGARVIKAASHRVYESTSSGNVGNDPTGVSGKWIDIGATNRWAMFDQALGSATAKAGPITVTVDAPAIQAIALLDVVGTTIRVQATGYDSTVPAGGGATTFLDLPTGTTRVTVTIAGGATAVGTMLAGRLVSLGITEASPTAGITDYSRKDVDDFGEVTIVQRAWAKRMTANALIATSAIDKVVGRIATVRARPSLWIGQAGLDSLTIYGFFKDFSIERGDGVSKLSLSIEGLSTAGKIEPLKTGIDWPDVGDPAGTKPQDNATVGAPGDTPVGGVKQSNGTITGSRPANSILADIDQLIADVAAGGGAEEAKEAAEAARDAAIVARDATLVARDAADADALAAAQHAGDANNYAVTALGQASIATQKADEAGQKAALATAKTEIAITKAGEASTSAASALQSEQNSAGSVVQAAALQQLTATTAADAGKALAAMFPRAVRADAFTVDPNNLDGAAIPAQIAQNGRIAQDTAVPAIYPYGLWMRGLVPCTAGKKYRLTAKAEWVSGYPDQPCFCFYSYYYGANGAVVAAYPIGQPVTLPANIPTDMIMEIEGFPAGAVWMRIGIITNRKPTNLGNVTIGRTDILALYLDDITSERASTDSATASVSGASTATAKATEAGQYAQAANQSKVDAQAANAGAQTQAGVSTQQAAVATAQAAAANQSAILSSKMVSGAADMLNRNATFSQWPDPSNYPALWAYGSGGGTVGVHLFRVEGKVGPYALRHVQAGQADAYIATNGQGGFDSAIDPGIANLGPGQYVLEADFELESGGLQGSGMYAAAYSDQNVGVGYWPWAFATEPDVNGVVNGAGAPGRRYRFTKLFASTDARTYHFRLHPMTAWAGFGAGVDKTIIWHKFGIRRATAAEIAANKALADAAAASAQVSQEASTRAGETSALASRVSGTEARVGSVEARTAITETSVADLQGKAASRIKLEAVAGNGRAQVSIFADANGGAGVDIVGDTNFKGRVIHDNGTIMKVQGIGFGTNNQFIEWVGPSRAISACDEAGAVQYIKTDGSAYFGGTLSVGTLKNAAASSQTAADAAISLGPFGSNGHQRQIVVSYTFDRSRTTTSGGSVSGTPTATIQLRRDGPSGALLATLNVTGTTDAVSAAGPGETGRCHEAMGGSTTFTDSTGGTGPITFYAQITSRSLSTFSGASSTADRIVQSLGLVSTEQ